MPSRPKEAPDFCTHPMISQCRCKLHMAARAKERYLIEHADDPQDAPLDTTWRMFAKCAQEGMPVDFFFQGASERHMILVRAYCSNCLVRTDCAQAGEREAGAWGGVWHDEKIPMARQSRWMFQNA